MPSFDQLLKGFYEHPTALLCVLLVGGIAYLFRELQKTNAALLTTATAIAPVSAKLAEGVSALERMIAHLPKE